MKLIPVPDTSNVCFLIGTSFITIYTRQIVLYNPIKSRSKDPDADLELDWVGLNHWLYDTPMPEKFYLCANCTDKSRKAALDFLGKLKAEGGIKNHVVFIDNYMVENDRNGSQHYSYTFVSADYCRFAWGNIPSFNVYMVVDGDHVYVEGEIKIEYCNNTKPKKNNHEKNNNARYPDNANR